MIIEIPVVPDGYFQALPRSLGMSDENVFAAFELKRGARHLRLKGYWTGVSGDIVLKVREAAHALGCAEPRGEC